MTRPMRFAEPVTRTRRLASMGNRYVSESTYSADRLGNVLGGVRRRYECSFELRRREIDPVFEHMVEEAAESRRIRALGFFVIANRPPAEEKGEHRAHTVDVHTLRWILRNTRRSCLELVVHLGMLFQVREHGDTGGHREWVAGQRSRLINRSSRGDLAHDVSPAPIRCNRQSPTQDLAERGEIGSNVVKLLSPASAQAKASHYFVEDQQSPVVFRYSPQPLEESRLGRNAAHIANHRFHNDGGDSISFPREDCFHLIEVV